MKNIKELPITVQMALAIKTPELFNKKEFERLMKVKMKKYKYNNKIVSKKFWLKTLKQYPGFKRKKHS